MASVDPLIPRAVQRMRENARERDAAMERVRMVRDGKYQEVWPNEFSDRYPNAIIANFTDVAARDIASNLAPMPSLSCSAGAMQTASDKTRAEKKNRIGAYYWKKSALEVAMVTGADQWVSYGFLPFWVEPNYVWQCPVIHVLDPRGCYYELDRFGETVRFCRVWRTDRSEFAALFEDKPEVRNRILMDFSTGQAKVREQQDIEVVQYIDRNQTIVYIPESGNMIADAYSHDYGFAPIRIAVRPGLHDKPRGQFDDVLHIQMAAAVMASLTLEAGHKAVQAPLVLPTDVTELNIGPDAILQTDNGDKVGRVAINVPPAAFELSNQLSEEMNQGAGYPNTRLGIPGQANVTGRGINALEGGFDSQIALGQTVLGLALRESTKMAFKIDASLWPNVTKTIRGTLSGETFQVTYRPGKDINDDVECEVEYGFASGSTGQQGKIVTLLQLRGDGLIGRDTVRRQLPWDIDVDQQQRELDVQAMEDALKNGLTAALTASGQMLAQGMQQQVAQLIQIAQQVGEGRMQGKPLIDLFAEAFPVQPPPPPTPGPVGPDGQPAPGGPPGPGGGVGPDGQPLPGVEDNGLPQGVAAGQAGMAPGGRPSVSNLAAGFTNSGAANLSDTIQRRLPIG